MYRKRLCIESFMKDSTNDNNLKRGFHRKTLTILTEETDAFKMKEELITPKNYVINPESYYFTNSWQKSLNKVEFNFSLNKNNELNFTSDKSKSTLKRAEEYLDCKNNSSIKIDFDNFEIEKIKLRWSECVKISSEAFTIKSNKKIRFFPVFIINVIIILICLYIYSRYILKAYLISISNNPLFKYEIVYHSNIKDFMNYK